MMNAQRNARVAMVRELVRRFDWNLTCYQIFNPGLFAGRLVGSCNRVL